MIGRPQAKRLRFYVPGGDTVTWESFKTLRKGDKVAVTGPVLGRAESIVTER
jgi:hypothetical protein